MLFCRCAVLSPRCFVTELPALSYLHRFVVVFYCLHVFFLSLQLCRIFFCRSSVLLTCSLPLLFCWCVASSRTVWSLSFLPLRCFPPRAVCRVLVCRTNSQMNERLRLPPIELAVILHFRFISFLQRWPSSRILKSYAQCLRKRALAATASSKGGTTTRRAAPANPSSMVAAGAT